MFTYKANPNDVYISACRQDEFVVVVLRPWGVMALLVVHRPRGVKVVWWAHPPQIVIGLWCQSATGSKSGSDRGVRGGCSLLGASWRVLLCVTDYTSNFRRLASYIQASSTWTVVGFYGCHVFCWLTVELCIIFCGWTLMWIELWCRMKLVTNLFL